MANNRNELTYGFFQKIPNILLFILGQSEPRNNVERCSR